MASLQAAAEKRAKAVERLSAAMDALGYKLGVASIEIAQHGPATDPVMGQANQLDLIATWAEQIAVATGAITQHEPDDMDTLEPDDIADETSPDDDTDDLDFPADSIDYETMTVAELRELADERRVHLDGITRKADIIAALEDFDSTDVQI